MSKIAEILSESEIRFFMEFLGYGNPEESKYWFIGNEERGSIRQKIDALRLAKPIHIDKNYFSLDPFDAHGIHSRFKGSEISSTWWKILEIYDQTNGYFFMKNKKQNLSSVFMGELYPISLDGGYVSRDEMANMEGFSERRAKLTEIVNEAERKNIVLYSTDFWKGNSNLSFLEKNRNMIKFLNEKNGDYITYIAFGNNERGSKIVLMPHLTTRFLDTKFVIDSIVSFFDDHNPP